MEDGTARQLTAMVLQEMIEQSEFFQSTASVVPALPSFSPSGKKICCGQYFLHERTGTPHSSLLISNFVFLFHFVAGTDIQVGKLLGHGQFGEVLELVHLTVEQESEPNARVANEITQHKENYAVKRLFRNVQTSLCDDAIADLGCEAMFLSRLSGHENIISLHATVGVPGSSSYMLILDRLVSNLHQKTQEWRSERQRYRGKALGFWNRNRAGLDALYSVQLKAATDIARALQYLHSHRILFRDIKVSLAFSIINYIIFIYFRFLTRIIRSLLLVYSA
jgi:serine/threonine protein kinase